MREFVPKFQLTTNSQSKKPNYQFHTFPLLRGENVDRQKGLKYLSKASEAGSFKQRTFSCFTV